MSVAGQYIALLEDRLALATKQKAEALARAEKSEQALELLRELAVVDFDDEAVGIVNRAIGPKTTYGDWLRKIMTAAENAAKFEAELQGIKEADMGEIRELNRLLEKAQAKLLTTDIERLTVTGLLAVAIHHLRKAGLTEKAADLQGQAEEAHVAALKP